MWPSRRDCEDDDGSEDEPDDTCGRIYCMCGWLTVVLMTLCGFICMVLWDHTGKTNEPLHAVGLVLLAPFLVLICVAR